MKRAVILIFSILISSTVTFTGCNSEKVYQTDEIIKFAKSVWNADGKYNGVKFKVTQEKFIGKWAKMTGEIKFISEKGEVSFNILGGEREIDWDRYISMQFTFDTPKDVINFCEGQVITIEGEFEKAENGSLSNYGYDFIFKDAHVLPLDSITTRKHITLQNRKALQDLYDSIKADTTK